jgi:AraC-like DNA-binding protein
MFFFANQSSMAESMEIYRVQSISELHHLTGLGKPKHPLLTIVDYSKVDARKAPEEGRFVCDFYAITFKNNCSLGYGRQFFDHQEGTLLCTAPEQVLHLKKPERMEDIAGWGLFFHPELIRNAPLGKQISEYTFFRYEENEALHLSGDEKKILTTLLSQIKNEYQTIPDGHSRTILVTYLELLLKYCQRFYGRQFITRTHQNRDLMTRFGQLVTEYLVSGQAKDAGLPTVKCFAEKMNLSANYFSDLLKSETSKSAREHLHHYVLERAKTLLLGTNCPVNEIAFELGFEYPQN